MKILIYNNGDFFMNNYPFNDSIIKFAKINSVVCEAPILAFFVFLIFNLFLDYDNFLIVELTSLIFGTALPILFVVFWSKFKQIDRDYTDKDTRHLPFIFVIIIYIIGSIILWLLDANPLTITLMFCYGTNTLIVFFINLKWKISVHAMGVTGPTTALMFFNPLGFLMGFLTPLVMWSRVILNKHSPNQVLAGAVLGYILTFTQFYLLLNILHYNIINLSILWIFILIIISLITHLLLRN